MRDMPPAESTPDSPILSPFDALSYQRREIFGGWIFAIAQHINPEVSDRPLD